MQFRHPRFFVHVLLTGMIVGAVGWATFQGGGPSASVALAHPLVAQQPGSGCAAGRGGATETGCARSGPCHARRGLSLHQPVVRRQPEQLAAGSVLFQRNPLASALGRADHSGSQGQRRCQEIKLQDILQAVENSPLKQLEESIQAKDREKFVAAYEFTLTSCYACHKASDKPYLRPRIPDHPASAMMNFDPNATWPK